MTIYDDEWDEDDDSYGEDSGDEPTVPCPFCKRDILEESGMFLEDPLEGTA